MERKGRRLKGGDGEKEERGKEKKVIKGEMKRKKLKGGIIEKKGKRAKEKRFMKGKEKGRRLMGKNAGRIENGEEMS